jgi:hypothetical protein
VLPLFHSSPKMSLKIKSGVARPAAPSPSRPGSNRRAPHGRQSAHKRSGYAKGGVAQRVQEGHKECHKEEQARMLALIEEGYTLEQIKAILRTGQDDR